MKNLKLTSTLLSLFLITSSSTTVLAAENVATNKDTTQTAIAKSSNDDYSSKGSAKSIRLNKNNTFSLYEDNYTNKQWSKFTVPSDGVVTLDLEMFLTGDNHEKSTSILLEDESGSNTYLNTSSTSESGTEYGDHKKWNIGLKKGTYYLCLTNSNSVMSQVNLNYKVSFEQCDDFEKENNDDFKSANPIDIDKTYRGIMSGYDSDYFVFKNDTSNLSITLQRDNIDTTYYLRLYDVTGNSISEKNVQYLDGGFTTYNFGNLRPGQFYIKITNGLYGSKRESYKFNITKGVNGWVNNNSNWYYYDNGEMKTGLVTIDDKKYFLDYNGIRQVGWQYMNNHWYYFNPSTGTGQTGWLYLNGCYYHFDNDGTMNTGWETIDNNKYFFSSDGYMMTGWVRNGYNSWRFLGSNGAMRTGWIYDAGYWFYLDPYDGDMCTGLKTIDNQQYYFNSSGAMRTGWVEFTYFWKHFNSSGALTKGWLFENGSWYFTDSDGDMVTGYRFIDGHLYYFNDSGRLIATY